MIRLFSLLFVFLSAFVHAGSGTQNVRGVVKDNLSGQPLENVTVIIFNESIEHGTSTNQAGEFLFKELPLDYYTIYFSYVGYESIIQHRVRLVSSREYYTVVEMNISSELIEGATIVSTVRKDRPNNPRAMVSSRSFSLEETNQYAGSYGDPARMAINYAGVLPARDNRNDIIIRGNTSYGLLWKLDGIEIPNPNHFGATGSTGGPITIINNNLLNNSDFFTAAFPAEYSNATAGVFDLKMNPGNPDNHNKWAQLGWNGLEIGSEGPLYEAKNITYASAYRYSFVDILSRIGFDLPDAVKYQDLSLKVNVPNTSLGNFSLTAMGGSSNIGILNSKLDPKDWLFADRSGEDVDNTYSMGVLGLTHSTLINSNSLLTTTLSITGSSVENKIDTFTVESPAPFRWGHEKSDEYRLAVSASVKHRFSPKLDASMGFHADKFIVNFTDKQYVHNSYSVIINSGNQELDLYRLYADATYRLRNNFRTYIGINTQYFAFSHETLFEPRLGIQWDLSEKHMLSFGSGLHSQMQPRMIYFVISNANINHQKLTNINLKHTKSYHNVLGYDFLISRNLRLKTEVYYQYIFDAPVSLAKPAYSVLNHGAEFYVDRPDSLINNGTGRNYGIDVTLERFWSNNFFCLITGSLFESNYTGQDGIKRNTAFNGKFAVNLLAGYEIHLSQINRSMTFGINLTYAGGRPYVPYDIEASMKKKEVILAWNQAYEVQRDDYKRASLRIGMRQNIRNANIETAIDLQFRSDYTNIYYDRLDIETGEIIKTYSMGFYPMANVRIEF